MVNLEWDIARRDGVALVTATVTNTQTTPQTVRLESRLDGPTWPPRADGLTSPSWTDDGWTATIEPGWRRGVGFASSAEPTEPPLEIVDVRRASDDERPNSEAVLASLEAWAPTADVLTREP